MTTDTIQFNADDASLAVNMMVDEAMAEVPFTSLQQTNADTMKATTEARAIVAAVMRLHGVTTLGDSDLGDEARAREVMTACEEFRADQDGYIDRVSAGDEPETAPAEPPASALPLPSSPPEPFAEPAIALGMAPLAAPPRVVVPEARIRFIDRAAKSLFPGVGALYETEQVPTVKWETPKPHVPERDQHYSFPGFAVKVMISAIRRRKNVAAVGDPGCGKTEFFKQFGYAIGLPVHVVPFDGSLTRAEIIGGFRQIATPTGSATPFVDGLLPTFIQQPCIIVLDEFDQADPDMQYVLHKLYEGEGITIMEDGGRFVARHEHCYIVAAANTKGRGSDNGLTHARHEMSEATRDRFPYWLEFTYLTAEKEAATITAKTGLDLALSKKLVSVGEAIRTAYKAGSLAQPCSLRQLLDAAETTEDFMAMGPDVALALACKVVIVGRANDQDADVIREAVNQTVGVDLEVLEH